MAPIACEPPNDVWSRLARFLDLHLLRDGVYLNICLGMSFALYSDITFFTVQPIYLRQALGYAPTTVAHIIAIGAASDLLGRFSLALFGAWAPTVRARRIYLAGAVLSIAARIGKRIYGGAICISHTHNGRRAARIVLQ